MRIPLTLLVILLTAAFSRGCDKATEVGHAEETPDIVADVKTPELCDIPGGFIMRCDDDKVELAIEFVKDELYLLGGTDLAFMTFLPSSDPKSSPILFLRKVNGKPLNEVVDYKTWERIGSVFYRDKNRFYCHHARSDGGWLMATALDPDAVIFRRDEMAFKTIAPKLQALMKQHRGIVTDGRYVMDVRCNIRKFEE